MDPKTRRRIWDFILSIKEERLILLTTHSMEEADALAEKIAIIRAGQLVCVGTPQHLKARFGNGYRLNVVSSEEMIHAVIQNVQRLAPGL
jgi:ABC-type multidrug transport system ATPase subunit